MEPKDDSPSSDQSERDRLAQNVRKARQDRQLSLAELAQKTGLPHEFLEAVENGAIDPSALGLGDLEVLAKALGVEEAKLFRRGR